MFRKEIKTIMAYVCLISFFSCTNTLPVKKNIDEFTIVNKNIDILNNTNRHYDKLIKQNRKIVSPFFLCEFWSVDSVIYLNEAGTRFFTHLLKRELEWKHAKMDLAKEVIGAYVNGEWHYLLGDQILFPRDHFKYNANTPFTFEELSYLVNRRLFPRIVSKIDREYKVSEEFFAKKLGELDSSAPNGDSLFLKAIENLSTKSVSQEKLDRIRQEQLDSKPRELPKRTLWQRWFGKKKLFDSRAWKNSIKDK